MSSTFLRFLSNLERFPLFLSYRSWKTWKIFPQTLSGSVYFKPFFSSGTHILSPQGPVKSVLTGTSLIAQWIRLCLPMQGTRVQCLVQEDSTSHRATKPVHHNQWARTLQPASPHYWTRVPGACALQQDKPPQWEGRAPQPRVALRAATRESPRKGTKTQHSQNSNKQFFKLFLYVFLFISSWASRHSGQWEFLCKALVPQISYQWLIYSRRWQHPV